MPRTLLLLAATASLAVLSAAAQAQQALPTIGGTSAGGDNSTAARERSASSAIEQQVEYRTSLQRDLATREQMLRTSEKDLEARKLRLRNTHQELLTTAQKVQEQAAKLKAAESAAAAAPAPDTADTQATDGSTPTEQPAAAADSVDPSMVKRLSKDLEVQSYEIQVASAQIKRLQQDVDYLRGVIAQMSGARR